MSSGRRPAVKRRRRSAAIVSSESLLLVSNSRAPSRRFGSRTVVVGRADRREPLGRPVGRVFADQLEVTLADLGLVGMGGQAQDFVRITHERSAFLRASAPASAPRLRLRPTSASARLWLRIGPWPRVPAEHRRAPIGLVVVVEVIVIVVDNRHHRTGRSPSSRLSTSTRSENPGGPPEDENGPGPNAPNGMLLSPEAEVLDHRQLLLNLGHELGVERVFRALGQRKRLLEALACVPEAAPAERTLLELDGAGHHVEPRRLGEQFFSPLHQLRVQGSLFRESRQGRRRRRPGRAGDI